MFSSLVRVFLVSLLFALATASHAEVISINDAINKAGRQRMLSQRIAKAYLQLGQHADESRARRVLDDSITLFDRQLVELKNYAPTPEIRQTYQQLQQSWIQYKDLLVGSSPSLANGKKIVALADEILELTQRGTRQFEKQAGTQAGRLLNLAGQQRMLSQRMAAQYYALNWGIAKENAITQLDKARDDFRRALSELSAASANNARIQDELRLAEQQWAFFDNAVSQRGGDSEQRLALNVSTTSERLLETMEQVTTLFEHQAR